MKIQLSNQTTKSKFHRVINKQGNNSIKLKNVLPRGFLSIEIGNLPLIGNISRILIDMWYKILYYSNKFLFKQ